MSELDKRPENKIKNRKSKFLNSSENHEDTRKSRNHLKIKKEDNKDKISEEREIEFRNNVAKSFVTIETEIMKIGLMRFFQFLILTFTFLTLIALFFLNVKLKIMNDNLQIIQDSFIKNNESVIRFEDL